jgi:hypothetical protein
MRKYDEVQALLKELRDDKGTSGSQHEREAMILTEKIRHEAADEIERLRAAVALSVYELHFVADEHDCEQCREAAKSIMKIAKGGPHD